MAIFPIGDQRVGIERTTAVLDEDQNPVYTEFNEPVTTASIVWVDGACFEIQTPTEQQNLTVTTSEIAWAFLPVADGKVPAVAITTVAGQPVETPAPVQFFSSGKPTISSSLWLWHNGLRYAMRGDAVLEQDIHGRQDHVFCVCEREQG